MGQQRLPRASKAAAAPRMESRPPRVCTWGREIESMNFNLAVILSETAAASPAKPVALYDGGQLTYGQLDELSDRLGARLGKAGVEAGGSGGRQPADNPPVL